MVYLLENLHCLKNPALKIAISPTLSLNILSLGWKCSSELSKIIPQQLRKKTVYYVTNRNLSRTITLLNCSQQEFESTKQSNFYLDVFSNLKVDFLIAFLKMEKRNFNLTPHFNNCVEYINKKQNYVYFNTKSELREKYFSKQIVTKKEKSAPKEEMEENWGGHEAFKSIIFVKEDFDGVINKYPSVLMFFSASWCQHCLKLRKPFGKAAVMAKEANLPIVFATFDVNTNPDIADEKGVVGIPTLKYYKNGKFISNYKGKRTAEDLFDFAKNPPQPSTEGKKADI